MQAAGELRSPCRPGGLRYVKPAALVLSPETPFPVMGGGALRTASLLHYLAPRYDVDLLVFRQPNAPDPHQALPPGLLRSIAVLDLPANGRDFASRAFRNASRVLRRVSPLVDRYAGFGPAVAAAFPRRTYDLGIVEHSWAAPYLEQIAPRCRRTVLDLHNIESVLHDRCARTETGPLAFAHRTFRDASRELERIWLPRYSQVLATSESDALLARDLAPASKIAVYPNALPPTSRPPHLDDEALVFSGNLEYHPNVTAVRFFREQVWPMLRERFPDLVWRLVGRNPAAVRRYTQGDPRIEIVGPVDDAVTELGRSRVAVVPLLSGSGTRLKILEAWAAGLPVVSTTLGAEGLPVTPDVTVLLADGPENFAKAVTRLLTCTELRRSLGEAGRSLLDKEFTWETAWAKLDF
jgi:glycosyltransferase involved in cell wall biosynthesis